MIVLVVVRSDELARERIGANDIAHVVIAYTEVLLLMLIIGFGSDVDGRWFRVYSILTILAALAGGVWVCT